MCIDLSGYIWGVLFLKQAEKTRIVFLRRTIISPYGYFKKNNYKLQRSFVKIEEYYQHYKLKFAQNIL